MTAAATTTAPFSATRWSLLAGEADGDGHVLRLEPIDSALADVLAQAAAAIDPWRRMGYRADVLARTLGENASGTCRRAIFSGNAPVGAVSVRYPWLRGPYLELLAILPGHQSGGAGAAILDWMAREVEGRAHNLWVCASSFNDRALAFYERHGFARVADLDGLVGPDFTEILLRKRL